MHNDFSSAMTAEQAAEAAKGLTFEKVWAAIMESRANSEKEMAEFKKSMLELNKSMGESLKESLRESLSESLGESLWETLHKDNLEFQKSLDKTMKELSENLGGISNSMGDITQALFKSDIWKLFTDYGYEFTRQGPNVDYYVGTKKVAEVDFCLENGTYVMPVEVKTRLTNKDIDKHLDRINIIRQYMDARKDARKLVGAVAGAILTDAVTEYAHKNGMYVLTLVGESVAIVGAPPNFQAREW